jgi:hypothetical protein
VAGLGDGLRQVLHHPVHVGTSFHRSLTLI